ncbi:AzlC family ABC transporter permease [Halomonas eurihalina]|uniref:AzlC family ABC transporter permease n=1 Tax=Halomonas eurihalina TaxID=42566 RepID=A0A5D9DDB5_HALER|nr:AzlC family ABC transporter permease [Halomonas eurihalina]MDR5857997.1 AzlC family ABC transporter permease [Halomonas eurihalina]TZG41493.1 AzlC family ABC transporter permease [Halomonas eurihalina]
MTTRTHPLRATSWLTGMREATPLLGGYIPVAISFGLIAIQTGFTAWEATLISVLVYAGASQFLFIGMAAAGAPLWLVVAMTLLINVRHVVYAPNLAPWLTASRYWPWLMHGLTDQVFALAHSRLPQLPEHQRLGWYTGAALLAWASWIAGTLLGAVAGDWLMAQWPLLGEVMPFALPALFLVLVMPRFTSRRWSLALCLTIVTAMICTLAGLTNLGIPLAALCGALCFYLVKFDSRQTGGSHE